MSPLHWMLQTGMGRSSSVVDEEADLMSDDGTQRGIVDVKVDGASRDGGVRMNYRTHAAPPGDYQDDLDAAVGGRPCLVTGSMTAPRGRCDHVCRKHGKH